MPNGCRIAVAIDLVIRSVRNWAPPSVPNVRLNCESLGKIYAGMATVNSIKHVEYSFLIGGVIFSEDLIVGTKNSTIKDRKPKIQDALLPERTSAANPKMLPIADITLLKYVVYFERET